MRLRGSGAPARRSGPGHEDLRILQIINTLAVTDGGPARYGYELHMALESSPGVRASMAVVRKDGESVVFEPALARSHAKRPPAILAGASAPAVVRAIARHDVVVVHGYYLWWAPLAALAGRLLGRRVLLTPHGTFTRYKQERSRGKKLVFDRTAGVVLRRAVQALALGSPEEVDDAAAKMPRSTIAVCGVGTVIPPLAAPSDGSPGLRLLSVSRIAPGKRVDLMIRAAAELRRRGLEVLLTVAGSGPPALVDDLKRLAQSEGVEDQVEFAGLVEGAEKAALYRDADVFLALSDDENFGISVAEALAHGVPCVASAFVPAAVGMDPTCGRVVTDRAPGVVAEAVLELEALPRPERFAAARAHAESHFGWDAVARRWIDLAADRPAR